MLFLLVLLLITFAILIKKWISEWDPRILVQSSIDNHYYLVRNIPTRQQTADILATLNQRLMRIIEEGKNDNSPQHIAAIKRLAMRYDPINLSESLIEEGMTSFTVDKGKDISLCVRTRDAKDEPYDLSLLTMVLVHEAAHIASIEVGHGYEFMENYRYLLQIAERLDMYKPKNKPVNYCNLILQHA